MLRKSPYLEENYGYLTSMMDSVKIHDEVLTNKFDIQPTNTPNFFFKNQEPNKCMFFSNKNFNMKKEIEIEHSVFGMSNTLHI